MARVTLKDIAKDTGLTINSVSRALNDMPDISEKTKQRVRQAALNMGYVKNLAASGLRKGCSRIIGVLYDNLLNPYYSIMSKYIQQSLDRYDYSYLTFFNKDGVMTKKDVQKIMMRGVDGIISFLEPEDAEWGLLPLPILLLGRKSSKAGMDFITTDDFKGGRLAGEKLVELGYTAPLFVGERRDISCVFDRYSGFRAALEEHGLYDESRTVFLNGRLLTHTLARLQTEGLQYDSIFCFNDLLALEAVNYLSETGHTDVAVIGYDDIQAEMALPGRLTTVGTDKKQMAEVAVEVLLLKIEDKSKQTRHFSKLHDVYLTLGVTSPRARLKQNDYTEAVQANALKI